MKASIEVTDMFTVMAISVAFILLITQVPKIWDEFFSQLALATSKIVVYDLSGIISISAAAPQEIIISYDGLFKKINYTVDLENRKIKLQMLVDGEPLDETYSNYYAVDGLDKTIENCNKFKVSKERNGLDNTFDFWCYG